jgi:hypothetical protein
MWYGNKSFDYVAEAVKLRMTVRHECYLNVTQNFFQGYWRDGNVTAACPKLCENVQYDLIQDAIQSYQKKMIGPLVITSKIFSLLREICQSQVSPIIF